MRTVRIKPCWRWRVNQALTRVCRIPLSAMRTRLLTYSESMAGAEKLPTFFRQSSDSSSCIAMVSAEFANGVGGHATGVHTA